MSDVEFTENAEVPVGTVTVQNPLFAPGEPIIVPNIGVIANESTLMVSEVQVANFKAAGYDWPESGNLVIDYKTVPLEEVPSGQEGTGSTPSSDGQVSSAAGSGSQPTGEQRPADGQAQDPGQGQPANGDPQGSTPVTE